MLIQVYANAKLFHFGFILHISMQNKQVNITSFNDVAFTFMIFNEYGAVNLA